MMSIEQIIISLEQCTDVLGYYTLVNEVPAIDLVQDTMMNLIENLKPYVKVVDLA